MNGRYRNNSIQSSSQGNRVYTSTILPDFDDLDIQFINITVDYGDRLDLLAKRYYNDSKLWWILARANGLGSGDLFVEAGQQLRIPRPNQLSTILRNVDQLNS